MPKVLTCPTVTSYSGGVLCVYVFMYVVCTCVRTYKDVTVCILSEYIKGHFS